VTQKRSPIKKQAPLKILRDSKKTSDEKRGTPKNAKGLKKRHSMKKEAPLKMPRG
jgi:hypothetical protein